MLHFPDYQIFPNFFTRGEDINIENLHLINNFSHISKIKFSIKWPHYELRCCWAAPPSKMLLLPAMLMTPKTAVWWMNPMVFPTFNVPPRRHNKATSLWSLLGKFVWFFIRFSFQVGFKTKKIWILFATVCVAFFNEWNISMQHSILLTMLQDLSLKYLMLTPHQTGGGGMRRVGDRRLILMDKWFVYFINLLFYVSCGKNKQKTTIFAFYLNFIVIFEQLSCLVVEFLKNIFFIHFMGKK